MELTQKEEEFFEKEKNDIENEISEHQKSKEEYMQSLNDVGLHEYKFFCNYGKVKLINVVHGRQNGDFIKEAFVDPDLKILNAHQDLNSLSQDEIKKPECYEKMIEFCEKTSKDIPLLRVDLMTDMKNMIFCEFTFYDCGGMNIFIPNEANYEIGNLFLV